MSRTNRLKKRFLEREGKKVMKDAMIKRAASEAMLEKRRTYVWKRASQVMLVICVCLSVGLISLGYALFNQQQLMAGITEKCK